MKFQLYRIFPLTLERLLQFSGSIIIIRNPLIVLQKEGLTISKNGWFYRAFFFNAFMGILTRIIG